jgi:hypothetical protein
MDISAKLQQSAIHGLVLPTIRHKNWHGIVSEIRQKKMIRGNVSRTEQYREERNQLVTISRDLSPPFYFVTIGSVSIFMAVFACISNIGTHPFVIVSSEISVSANRSICVKKPLKRN